MQEKLLTLESLARVDNGRMKVAMEQELQTIHNDLRDRPGVTGTRKVVLVLEFKPDLEPDRGDLAGAKLEFSIESKLPKRKSRRTDLRSAPGGMIFNDIAPENADQLTIDMAPQPVQEDVAKEEPQEEAQDAG